MESTYSLTRSFVTKDVTIFDQQQGWKFDIKLKTVKDFYTDDDWNNFYYLCTRTEDEYKKLIPIVPIKNCYEFLYTMIFTLGFYKEYQTTYNLIKKIMVELVPSFKIDTLQRVLMVGDDIILNEEICDYIFYVIKLSCGEKIEPPIQFVSPEAKAFYLAQKEAEAKVNKIKSQNKDSDKDALLKLLLSITYAFNSFTFDYLFEQTLAQIHWLANLAAGAVSYEVNSKIYAAGNSSGKPPAFFIK